MNVARAGEGVPNRLLITVSIMLATILQSLDTTIANVALPHMQGSLQGSQEQITWVLTSYIIAAAMITPLVPWLAGRIGRKTVFLVSVAGFTTASMLCGLAQNLPQMVGFRFLQGVFGAALMPLSQAVLLDINPPEKHGQAMSTYAMAAILGPIVGPALGGWLTDNYSWRWVFLINLPGGILAFTGIWLFMPDHKRADRQHFDFFGFSTLAIGIAALQLMLDRGASKDWLQSAEIWIELMVAVVAMYLFIVHTMTTSRPFFDRALARDRNFVAACVASFFIMSLLFSVLALVPPMLEQLMGYPVLTTGLVTMPRGVGMFLVMFAVGKLMGKVDTRLLIAIGLLISAFSLYAMSQFSLQMGSWPIIWTGFLQGVAIGLIFVPLSTIAFVTLAPHLRTEGSAVFNLTRNIGSAAGISVMQAILVSNSAKSHATLMEHLRPDNPIVQALHAPFNLSTPLGQAMLNALATKQAAMVAYVSNFRLMALATILVLPLILVLRKPSGAAPKIDVHID
jgi:DHA2 family multidrug resistance protein